VTASLDGVIAEVLRELDRWGVEYRLREHPAELDLWWAAEQTLESSVARRNATPLS